MDEQQQLDGPTGDEGESREGGESRGPDRSPGDNPLAHQFDFQLMMPTINVKMVNADRLGDYEIWLFSASVAISGCVGFAVAFAQGSPTPSGGTHHEAVFAAAAVMCLILFVAFFGRAIWIRRTLSREARTYPMRARQLSQQHDQE